MAHETNAEKNLKPVRTKEEARERGRKGGIASGEARRRKRTMKNAAKFLLDMPVASDNISETMKKMGFEEEDLTNQMAVLVSVFRKAMEGNVKAAEFLRDTAGQNDAKNEDRKLKKQQFSHRVDEFEYRKEKDAGISQEIEDMDEIEGEIYGNSYEEETTAEASEED